MIMKKFFAILAVVLCMVMALVMTGCAKKEEPVNDTTITDVVDDNKDNADDNIVDDGADNDGGQDAENGNDDNAAA